MTDSVDRRFARLPLEIRMADVCPGCGQHVMSITARLDWLANEGFPPAWCAGCRISKDLDKRIVVETASHETARKTDLATKWLDETT